MKGIAFLFPGQGAQYVGMGKDLCEEYPIARETFEEANNALGYDLMKLCFEGDLAELTRTENTQPAILTHSVAAFRVLIQEVDIVPEYVAGHSLGEYSALVCTGAIDFSDAVRLVHQRGKFMQEAVPVGKGAMMAVMKVEPYVVDQVCEEISTQDGIVVAANYNSPQQVVISGDEAAVKQAGEKLESMGALIKLLQVSAPFHSPLMRPATERMKGLLKEIDFGTIKWPVISNVSALPYRFGDRLVINLTEQIVKPVRWQETMEYLAKKGINKVVELGPGTVLKNLLKRSFPELEVLNLDTRDQVNSVKEGLDIKPDLNRVVSKSMAVAVATRNQNWDNDEYQKGVVLPYKEIQELRNQLDEETREATDDEVRKTLELLKTIMTTKKVPIQEQLERLNEILDMTGTQKLFNDLLPSA